MLENVTYDADNLVTTTKKLVTSSVLQLQSGQSVVRGTVLKKGTTGLVALTGATDIPYTVALQTVNATAAAKDLTYMKEGSVDASELTFGAGTIADFRDDFHVSTPILVEE